MFACVGNDDDLRSVVVGDGISGAFAGMKAGAIFVDHTTASADIARELSALEEKFYECILYTTDSADDSGAV